MEFLTKWIVKSAVALVPARYLQKLVGQPSLEELGNKEIARSPNPPVPGFNILLEVEGVREGSVRYFTRPDNWQPDDPVILFLHGGAYMYALVPPQVAFLHYLQRKVPRAAIVWLDYTLCTNAPFPKQLDEAVHVYNKLAADGCCNIVLMGDSAGGHLAISLMRHQLEKFSKAAPITTDLRPSAAILISPWLVLDSETETPPVPPADSSFQKYRWKDYIGYGGLVTCGRVVLDEEAWPGCRKLFGEMYKQTSVEWSKVLPPKTLVTCGECEVLSDSIKQFHKIACPSAQLFVEPNAVHDTPAIFGPKRSGVTKVVIDFLSEKSSGAEATTAEASTAETSTAKPNSKL